MKMIHPTLKDLKWEIQTLNNNPYILRKEKIDKNSVHSFIEQQNQKKKGKLI